MQKRSGAYSRAGYLREHYRYFHLRDTAGQERDYHFHEFDKLVLLLSGCRMRIIDGMIADQVMELEQTEPAETPDHSARLRTIFRDRQPDYSVPVSVAEKLTLRFPDDGLSQHTVLYLAPNESTANYRIYLETPDGYERLHPERFGSYFAFPIPGHTATVCLVTAM